MFSTDDFRQLVAEDMPGYVEATISGSAVDALFGSAYAESLGIATSRPLLRCVPADVFSLAVEASVTVSGTSYTVASIERSPTQLTVLNLQKVAS